MRRPATITLALMGAGAVAAGGYGLFGRSGDSDACREARALNRPDAACRSSSSSSSRGGYSSSGDSASSSSRGGFGASGVTAGS